MTISQWIRLRMRSVSNESCRENQNTHFMFGYFFRKSSLWENVGARHDAENMAPGHGILDKLASTRPRPWTYTPPPPHTHTHKHVILIDFHGNSCFVNAPQCYVTCTPSCSVFVANYMHKQYIWQHIHFYCNMFRHNSATIREYRPNLKLVTFKLLTTKEITLTKFLHVVNSVVIHL
jgi:hypothetical protein